MSCCGVLGDVSVDILGDLEHFVSKLVTEAKLEEELIKNHYSAITKQDSTRQNWPPSQFRVPPLQKPVSCRRNVEKTKLKT